MFNAQSNKKKPIAYENGYEYRFDKNSKDGTKSFWRCTRRDCKARAVGDIGSPVIRANEKVMGHYHLPQPAMQKIRVHLAKAKEEAQNNKRKTSEIVQEAKRNLSEEEKNLMPKESCILRRVQNAKLKSKNNSLE